MHRYLYPFSFSLLIRCLPRKPLPPVMVIRLCFMFCSDRIYWIFGIFLLFSPFPEEREKDNPLLAEKKLGFLL